MNWIECSKLTEAFGQSRFSWPEAGWEGFNCETGLTISDITGGISWIGTYPGDALLRMPQINAFFELPPDQTGGYISAGLGFLIAYTAMIFVGGVLEAVSR